jgi:hypothetical protein
MRQTGGLRGLDHARLLRGQRGAYGRKQEQAVRPGVASHKEACSSKLASAISTASPHSERAVAAQRTSTRTRAWRASKRGTSNCPSRPLAPLTRTLGSALLLMR